MLKLCTILAITTIGLTCSPKWAPDHYWAEKRWVLTEMKGVPVQLSGSNRDAFIEFSWTDKKFAGNGGCNRISGTYELDKKKDIQFKDSRNRYTTTMEAYQELFKPQTKKIAGESSTPYLYFHQQTIENIKRLVPDYEDIKILIVLRDPAERAYSQYMHND